MTTLTRAAVWAKTLGRCSYCGMQLSSDDDPRNMETEMAVDHRLPRVAGGLDTLENYWPSCHACNSAKASRTIDEFRLFASLHLRVPVRFLIDAPAPKRDILFVVTPQFYSALVDHNIPGRRKPARLKSRRKLWVLLAEQRRKERGGPYRSLAAAMGLPRS